MTSEALNESIISLATRRGMDPRPSLSVLEAALSLRERLNTNDSVIWPTDQGGLAWEAVGKSGRPRREGGSGRIFCVTFDGFPTTPDLWTRLDREAVPSNRRIIRVLLSHRKTTRSETESRYPKFIERLLDRLFPEDLHSSITDGAAAGFPDETASIPTSCPIPPWPEMDLSSRRFRWGFPPSYASWSGANALYLDGVLDIRERFLAAEVAAAIGRIPFIHLTGQDSPGAAAMARDSEVRRIVFLSEENDSIMASMRAALALPVLTPANETDMVGALEWALEHDGRVLILHPGKGALSARASLKARWESGSGVLVKEKDGGNAGRILFVVPGTVAKESVKAADRLIKDNFSVSVLSMRFTHPVDHSALRPVAGGFDLVLVVDSSGEAKGLGWSAGLPLLEDRSIHAVVVKAGYNGKSLAELAAGIHRENRFRRTVDDVKQDRW